MTPNQVEKINTVTLQIKYLGVSGFKEGAVSSAWSNQERFHGGGNPAEGWHSTRRASAGSGGGGPDSPFYTWLEHKL